MNSLKRILKIGTGILASTLLLLLLLMLGFYLTVKIEEPSPLSSPLIKVERTKVDTNFYKIHNNWLKKSETGLWELYVEGNGFERGIVEGKLQKELAEEQEEAFVAQIYKMIPSKILLRQMKYFIAYFNKDLDKHITQEYQEEIYGESLFASDKFDYIAPKYHRMLNYHAAHDIGHALQDKKFKIGCTAFSAWGQKTNDGSLLVGRNFDFFVGDDFAQNKVVNFINPSQGYKLVMISWAGMIGAVSGMNEKGLTVTINASKSEIPTKAATPISLVTREILQYAKNIDEAFAIAKKRKVFVSESILVGSAEDGKSAIIQINPSGTNLYENGDEDFIICSNHFQGDEYKLDLINLKNIENSSSMYRFRRMQELLDEKPHVSVTDAVSILRNQKGLKNIQLGRGNEKAINQLIAHHSVVFKPEKLQIWVSTNPYQLGAFICYDFTKVFALAKQLNAKEEIYEKELNVPNDDFLYSAGYNDYRIFRKLREKIIASTISEKEVKIFEQSNPEYYETYFLLGNYFRNKKDYAKALGFFRKALSKEIATKTERSLIENEISKLSSER